MKCMICGTDRDYGTPFDMTPLSDGKAVCNDCGLKALTWGIERYMEALQ